MYKCNEKEKNQMGKHFISFDFKLNLLFIDIKKEIPANSPDINIIENVWAMLKRYVRKKYCNSIEVLQHRVTKFFNKLRLKTVQNFVLHFKTVMRKIKEKKGDWSNL